MHLVVASIQSTALAILKPHNNTSNGCKRKQSNPGPAARGGTGGRSAYQRSVGMGEPKNGQSRRVRLYRITLISWFRGARIRGGTSGTTRRVGSFTNPPAGTTAPLRPPASPPLCLQPHLPPLSAPSRLQPPPACCPMPPSLVPQLLPVSFYPLLLTFLSTLVVARLELCVSKKQLCGCITVALGMSKELGISFHPLEKQNCPACLLKQNGERQPPHTSPQVCLVFTPGCRVPDQPQHSPTEGSAGAWRLKHPEARIFVISFTGTVRER